MTANADTLRDIVIANRILAHEEVVDAFGHISIRDPDNPEQYLLSRARAPELIEADDIVTFAQTGEGFGETNHLVVTMEQGRDLAATLGDRSISLMKRHGCVVAGRSVQETVMKAIYLQVNAKLQLQAMQIGTPDYLTDTEIAACTDMQQSPISLDRAWEAWCRRAERAK